MIAIWFICPLQNNNANYANNNKIRKWEQIKGERVEFWMITIIKFYTDKFHNNVEHDLELANMKKAYVMVKTLGSK